MRCKQCRDKAVMHMGQHRLALCKPHFLDWFVDFTARTIEKYHMLSPGERVLVAVSGGKDSLSLWDVLVRLGYQVDGLYIHLGIEGEDHYSDQSLQLAQDFTRQNNLSLHVFNVADEYGQTIPAFSRRLRRGQERPCGLCGLAKRHIMNSFTGLGGYPVLATGHNLDDEASVLLSNTMSWSVEQLQRQTPVLDSKPGFARKIKPFCRFYERETAAYALLRGIEYIYDECPHAEGNKTIYYKDMLNRLEADQPGAKYQFFMDFLNARKHGLFAPDPQLEQEPENNLQRCPRCGQPTTNTGLCAFCRVFQPVQNAG